MNSFLSIRRWGVAALASVTLLGGVMVIGEGVAAAAVTTNGAVTETSAVAFAATAVTVNFTPGGAVATGQTITAVFPAGFTDSSATPTLGGFVGGAAFTAGNCANDGSWSNTTHTLTFLLAGACADTAVASAFSIGTMFNPETGVYGASGFTVLISSDTGGAVVEANGLTTTHTTVASAAPTAASTPATGSASYTVTLTQPVLPVGNTTPFVYTLTGSVNGCLALSGTGVVTVTCTALAGGTTYSINYTAADAGGDVTTGTLSFAVTADLINQVAPTTGAVSVGGSAAFTAQLVTTGQGAGETFAANGASAPAGLLVSSAGVVTTTGALAAGTYVIPLTQGTTTDTAGDAGFFTYTLTVGASVAAIYGQTLDNTAAATFEHLSCAAGAHYKTAVLATDAQQFDSLSAAPLESALNRTIIGGPGTIANGYAVGLLLTSPTSLDPSMLQALNIEGVNTIYVVGGPLAISAADIAALQALPVTYCGGVAAPAGTKMSVVGPFYGPTATDTALAIDTEANGLSAQTSATALPSLTAVTPTMYNNTTATGSATGLAANNHTAIVVANTDFQDPAAAAGIAYKYQLPVILTPTDVLGPQAVSALTSLGITQVLAIGGQLAISPAVETAIVALGITVVPIAGTDGSDTSSKLAKFEQGVATKGLVWASTTVLLAQGLTVSDALGAGVLSGLNLVPQPLLLTEAPDAIAATDLGTSVIAELGVLGSTGVVSVQPLGGPLAVPANATALAVTSL